MRFFVLIIILSFFSCHSAWYKFGKISEEQELTSLINQSIYEINKMPGYNPYDGKDFWVWQRRDSLFIIEDGLSIFMTSTKIKDCYSYFDRNAWIVKEYKPSYKLFHNQSSDCNYAMNSTGYSGSEEIIYNGMIYKIHKKDGAFSYELIKSGNLNGFLKNNSVFNTKMAIMPEPKRKIFTP